MAVNLSGRADATLVKAATDAAMANVPMDVSRIHERISRSHAAMTASVGKSWGNAIKAVGQIGVALAENAKRKRNDAGTSFENTGTTDERKEMVDVMVGGEKVKVPFEDRFKYDSLRDVPEDVTGFKAISTFDYTDPDGNTTSIKVANTDQHVEKLRDDISGLSGARRAELKEIDRIAVEKEWSREEISSKKKKIKTFYKEEKRRLKNVKDNTNNSNRKFAAFGEILKSQLEGDNINLNASGMYGANKMNFANALLNKGKPLADGSKAVQGYDKNGNMVFTYVDKNNRPIKSDGKNLTLAEGDVGSLLVQKSTSRPIVENLFSDKSIANYNSLKLDDKVHMDKIEKVVKNGITDSKNPKAAFLDFAFMPTMGKTTLADAIHNVEYDANGMPIINPEEPTTLAGGFIKALNSISGDKENPHPYDMDGDGDFDKEDWGTEENYMKLTKRVLSGNELDVSIPLLEMHYKNQIGGVIDDARAKKDVIETVPNFKQLGFSNIGQYEKYLAERKNYGKTETDYKNRTVEFQFKLSDGTFEKTSTSSDEIINLDTQLNDLMGQSSFETENYVDLFGTKVGYFPNKGFAPVRINDAGQLTRKRTVKGGYWKKPQDVFKNFSIPTTYSKKEYVIGKIYTAKGGAKFKYVGGPNPFQPVK